MPIRFRCVHCHKALSIATRKAGTCIQCPTCQGETLVPVAARQDCPESLEPPRHEPLAPQPKTEPASGATARSIPPRSGTAPAAWNWRLHMPTAILGLLGLVLVIADFVRDLPRRHRLAVQDEAAFAVQIQDEPKEQVGDAAGPVKVEIKDELTEGGPAVAIDKTPLVKYALNTAPGGRLPPPGLRDSRTGPTTGLRLPNVGGVPMPANPLSFGVSATEAAGAGRNKLLTWSAYGHSNSTVVRIDGIQSELGGNKGRIVRFADLSLAEGFEPTPGAVSPSQSTWTVGADAKGNGGLRFHQILEVVPGQAVTVGGAPRRQLDTVLVRWVFDNQDTRRHKLGLRLHLDTLIGSNDGVPFTVPGRPGLVSTSADFAQPKDVPDFVQALEVPNLQNPGTVTHLTAKVGGKIEPPERLSLTCQQFWGFGFDPIRNWDYPIEDMRNDSAVVLYWPDKDLAIGAKRVVGFAYGLGQIASTDKLGITLGGSFEPGQSFTVTAYVEKPQPGQTLRLELPDGLGRLDGIATQPVAQAATSDTSLVSWKVQVVRTGTFRLAVHSSTGQYQAKTLTIARPDLGKLTLDLSGSFAPGQTFQVGAKVTDPTPGQTLTLQLPPGLQRVEGAEVQAVPGAVREAVVQWQVRVLEAGKFPVRVASSTGAVQRKNLLIEPPGGQAGRFTFDLIGDIRPGKEFKATAQVGEAVAGQTLTLVLPKELQIAEGAARQLVGSAGKVNWRVRVLASGRLPVRVESSTGLVRVKTVTLTENTDSSLFGR